MQRVVDTLLRAFAGRLSIAALVALSAGGVLSQPAVAQASPQDLTTQPQLTHKLSPEILAMHARVKRPVATAPTRSLELAANATATALASTNVNSEQGPGGGAIGPGPGCNLFPAPASVGAAVGLSYFGPPPSSVNQSLVGPVQLLNTGQVNDKIGAITIPLYLGHMRDGRNVWYVLTDVDDADVAAELGLNFSAKMTFMGNAARTAT